MTVFRELSNHILDIAENGVTAGASWLVITLCEDRQADRLTISIEDNGCGMSPELVRQVTDPWMTSRTTRKVGLGIPFFKQTAEMCGGTFAIQSTVGQGTLTTATFQYSHIDRPLLGDLVGTVLSLVVGYPQVALMYRHQVDGQSFELDTRAIRAVLGDEVPWSDPDVLAFLREMLVEGLGALGGESSLA